MAIIQLHVDRFTMRRFPLQLWRYQHRQPISTTTNDWMHGEPPPPRQRVANTGHHRKHVLVQADTGHQGEVISLTFSTSCESCTWPTQLICDVGWCHVICNGALPCWKTNLSWSNYGHQKCTRVYPLNEYQRSPPPQTITSITECRVVNQLRRRSSISSNHVSFRIRFWIHT